MGNLQPGVQVSLFDSGTTNLITDLIYSDDSTTTPNFNPFISSNGIIDFYIDDPRRLDIGIVDGDNSIQYIFDQDVLSAGSDSPHIGAASQSTQVGQDGVSTGVSSSSFGNTAQSLGVQSIAIGASAIAAGDQSTSVGTGSVEGTTSTGVGYNTNVSGTSSSVFGANSSSGNQHSTAIGADSTTTEDGQVMLGTATDFVEIPNYVVLTDPNGGRWALTIDTSGDLTTTAL